MKNRKAAGPSGLVLEMVKEVGEAGVDMNTEMFQQNGNNIWNFYKVKSWPVSFMFIGLGIRGIQEKVRSYKKFWWLSEAVKLPETVLSTDNYVI